MSNIITNIISHAPSSESILMVFFFIFVCWSATSSYNPNQISNYTEVQVADSRVEGSGFESRIWLLDYPFFSVLFQGSVLNKIALMELHEMTVFLDFSGSLYGTYIIRLTSPCSRPQSAGRSHLSLL